MRRIIVSLVVAVVAIAIAHIPSADGTPRAEQSVQCAKQKTALKKAETMSGSDAQERVREQGDKASRACFAERAKQETFFSAATRQAQDFLGRLPSQ